MTASAAPHLVHRTAKVRLRLTRRQTRRCYGLLRSAGDVWARLLDSNRQRHQQGGRPVTGYQALCRELTRTGPFGELSVTGARSVLQRYADAWFQAAKRRRAGQQDAGFPRRKRALVPVRFYNGTFLLDGDRVRLPVAKGQPELWVRLARPLPYPPSRSARSRCWSMVDGCGWRSPPPSPSNPTTWTPVGWPGWTLGSYIPTRW
jgi:hypothetical protein